MLRFELPPNYVGFVRLIEGSAGQNLTFDDGIETVKVPRDGVVRLFSLKPFDDGVQEHWYTAEGGELESQDTLKDPHATQVFDLGRGGRTGFPEQILFYVGTKAQIEKEGRDAQWRLTIKSP